MEKVKTLIIGSGPAGWHPDDDGHEGAGCPLRC